MLVIVYIINIRFSFCGPLHYGARIDAIKSKTSQHRMMETVMAVGICDHLNGNAPITCIDTTICHLQFDFQHLIQPEQYCRLPIQNEPHTFTLKDRCTRMLY